jgi:hypothetical protein
VANVAATVGTNQYAGWALVVAYRSESSPARMLLVRNTSQDDQWTIPRTKRMTASIAGLPTVTSGRHATIGVVAFEGDKGYVGDSLTANDTPLSNSDNPADNVFNSSIVLGIGRDPGLPIVPNEPNVSNSFGVDIDSFDTTVPVRAGHVEDQTGVTFEFKSGQDQVYLATIVLVVDLDVP